MSTMNEYELEQELHESGLEAAGEFGQGEGLLGTIGSALGGLFGESELEQNELGGLHEMEGMHELEGLHELEGMHELGGLHEMEGMHELAGLHEMEGMHELGGLHETEAMHELGGLHEMEGMHELEGLHELTEYESGEQFFGKIVRFVKRAAPILKTIAKVAAPVVGTAIGGPLGGMLGKVASSALGEGELHELEQELELNEYEHPEASHEVAHEIASHETTLHEAYAEMLAEAAAQEQGEGQAEAMAGAAAVSVISPADRRRLRIILPHLVRGAAILTRILRRRRITRPFVRTVPTIMRRTVRSLKQQAAAGRPITRRTAAAAAATQVRRVLGNPTACAAAIRKNVVVSRKVSAPRRRVAG